MVLITVAICNFLLHVNLFSSSLTLNNQFLLINAISKLEFGTKLMAMLNFGNKINSKQYLETKLIITLKFEKEKGNFAPKKNKSEFYWYGPNLEIEIGEHL